MKVHLGGHLAFYDPEKRSRFEVHLEAETALLDLVRELGIPEAEIALVGMTFPQDLFKKMPKLEWIQALAAGVPIWTRTDG